MQPPLKYVFITFLISMLLTLASDVIGQEPIEKKQYDNVQFWTSVNTTTRISQRWGVVADFHIRRNNFIKDPNFYFFRLGGAYWIDDHFSFVAGAAALWLATDTDVGLEYALERRTYQQALWRDKIGKVTFLQRIRVEQRWHEVLDPENGAVDRVRFSSRFRFLMSGTIRAFKSPNMPKPVISNEVLFHIGKEIVYNTFDQNRLFLGLSQRLGESWSMDIGYMLVYQQRYSGFEYDLNHTVRLFFYYSPDFRKKADAELPHYPVGGVE